MREGKEGKGEKGQQGHGIEFKRGGRGRMRGRGGIYEDYRAEIRGKVRENEGRKGSEDNAWKGKRGK